MLVVVFVFLTLEEVVLGLFIESLLARGYDYTVNSHEAPGVMTHKTEKAVAHDPRGENGELLPHF